jgi:saccharopine dehydrogenase-like NADP-dependent oxidoreductase
MQNILILGAGRSSTYLIEYLAKAVQKYSTQLTVADISLDWVYEKTQAFPHITPAFLNASDPISTAQLIEKQDIVVSLLPPSMQSSIAQICLDLGKHFLTASYITPEIEAMHEKVKSKNLLFISELGLDPGIDHLSAMQLIHSIQAQGGIIQSFKSFTGALIAPESTLSNPWQYKFTWNPRNVVLAGQGGTAKYIENHQYKYIPYYQLFQRIQDIFVESLGFFEAYINRDSLKYREIYGLQDIPTLLRGTLRAKEFCEAWNVLVKLGLTDDSFVIENAQQLTYYQWVASFLASHPSLELKENLAQQFNLSPTILHKLEWLGLFDHHKINMGTLEMNQGTPAQILQNLLEKKWKLEENDKDMIVMQHQIAYFQDNQLKNNISNLVVYGENAQKTAIAKTVGLPLAMAVELLMLDKIQLRGVVLPVVKEIYEPILQNLEKWGIVFDKL